MPVDAVEYDGFVAQGVQSFIVRECGVDPIVLIPASAAVNVLIRVCLDVICYPLAAGFLRSGFQQVDACQCHPKTKVVRMRIHKAWVNDAAIQVMALFSYWQA